MKLKPTQHKVKMDDLPVLPFEKVLSYLSLEDLIKSRAVSRSWCKMIDSFKVKSLCYSEYRIGFIYERNRWVGGAFAQNFISSSRFELFFKTFGKTIFSHLKHLRLYALDLHAGSRTAFTRALNSFGQLEELDLIGKWNSKRNNKKRRQLTLNLPMLRSVHFNEVCGIEKLTLNAPMLQKVKVSRSRLSLDLVYGESVEWFHVYWNFRCVKVESLKNLKYLYVGHGTEIDFPLLFGLKQLKAIYLTSDNDVHELFELKQRYGRADLKVYRLGCLLDGPEDPAMHSNFNLYNGENFLYLAANPSKLADEIPFCFLFNYAAIEHLAPELQANILNRLTGLVQISLDRPVQDIERFMNFLKTYNQIADIQTLSDQSPDLLDRLPEHCGLQRLNLLITHSDLEFLFRLKNLMYLHLWFARRMDTKTIRRALEGLEFLEYFQFQYLGTSPTCYEVYIKSSKRFKVYVDGKKQVDTRDLNAVIQFIELKTFVFFFTEKGSLKRF